MAVSTKRASAAAHRAKMDALYAVAREQVAAGKCPECGAGIHHNPSISGWWKCNRGGSGTFRIDNSGAHCSWQTFTE